MNMTRVLELSRLEPNDLTDKDALEEPLAAIERDYATLFPHLSAQGATMTSFLQSLDAVHSIRMRIKDGEALLAHLLRVKAQQPHLTLDPRTYTSLCADLVSILVLFEDMHDWRHIHAFITQTWKVTEQPCARVFRSDPLQRAEMFEEAGCTIVSGSYVPSVRYRILSDLAKRRIYTTISARSLMDEAFAVSQRVVGSLGDSPLARQYVDIMRFVGSLGMKTAAAAYEARRSGSAEPPPEPVELPHNRDDTEEELQHTRTLRRRRTAPSDRDASRPTELEATTPLKRPGNRPYDESEAASESVTIKSGDGEIVVAADPDTRAHRPRADEDDDEITATLYMPRKAATGKKDAGQ
jgi:hypothetical protein